MGGILVSSRMFQGVVLQMKDSVNRMVGVIDSGYKGSYQLIKDVWMKEEKQNGEIPESNDE